MGYSVRSIVSPEPEYEVDADEAGLRASLRDVPVLPAPANVDDLLARLDADAVPAGPLAEIISDARVVDVEPVDDEDYDPFFAPILHVANHNIPQPAPPGPSRAPRVLALLTAALVAGVALIGLNTLIAPDASLPEAAAPGVEVTAPITVAESEPEARSGAPEWLPVQPESEGVSQSEEATALAAEDAIPEAASRSEQASAPAAEEAIAESQPAEMAQSEVPVGGEAADNADAVADTDEIRTAEVIEAPALAATPAEPVLTQEQVESEVAVASTEPDSRQPESEPESAAEQPVQAMAEPASSPAPQPEAPSQELASANLDMTVTAPKPPVRPAARSRVPFAGVWGESPEACSGREEDSVLARISARRARAGDTTCAFRRIMRAGQSWQIAAVCSDGETSWKSDVRLSLSRRSLTWISQKGSTTYVRCQRG